MKKPTFVPAFSLACTIALLLSGCGGSDSDNKQDDIIAPTAVASLSAENTDINNTITLDGSASSSANAGITEWQWEVTSAPSNSIASPSGNTESSTFTADIVGEYQICLIVVDDKASSDKDCQSLTATNPNPTAVALNEVGTHPGYMVQLDASDSLPPTGGDKEDLVYHWTLASTPETSEAELENVNHALPRLTTDIEGEYVIKLIVSYFDKTSQEQTIKVRASHLNALPNPDFTIAGGDPEHWILGNTVTLNASTSTDDDGDTLEYRWMLGSNDRPGLPDGSSATLDTSNGEEITFTPDKFGNFYVQLAVYDGTIRRTINKAIKVNTLAPDHVNIAPTAIVGPDPITRSYEVELGGELNLTAYSTVDPEAMMSYSLEFEWEVLSYPNGFNTDNINLEGWKKTVLVDLPGDYTVRTRAFDGELWSEWNLATFTARTGANHAPTHVLALAGAGSSVLLGQTITFDGSQSFDPDDNQLNYHWQLVEKPNNSNAKLQNTDTANPTIVTDKPGPYTVELYVSDSHGASSIGGLKRKSRIVAMAKIENNKPIQRASLETEFSTLQPFVIYPAANDFVPHEFSERQPAAESLNAYIKVYSDAFDSDGDDLSYLWSITAEPQENNMRIPADITGHGDSTGLCLNGYTAQQEGEFKTWLEVFTGVLKMREWTCTNVAFSPSLAGNYHLQLLVSDGMNSSEPQSFVIPAVVREDYPSLLLEDLHASEYTSLDDNHKEAGNSFTQKLFPYNQSEKPNFPIFISNLEDNTEYLIKKFSLTAFDKDYTVTGLNAKSQDDYIIHFKGLSDGQVIPQGETITFELVLTTPSGMPVNQFRDLEPPQGINAGLHLEWSFDIKDHDNWSFKYKPFLYHLGI